MTIETWLVDAIADAEKRGLHELKPILEGLAASTRALRAADFNDDPSGSLESTADGQRPAGKSQFAASMQQPPDGNGARW
ncbi:MAG TPA: hypothetical protein VGG73_02875 [Vicinamibacterales bacterium]|jgi:hypothetical protein